MLKLWSELLRFANRPWVRLVGVTALYLMIIGALIVMYGKGDFSVPGFIYQNF